MVDVLIYKKFSILKWQISAGGGDKWNQSLWSKFSKGNPHSLLGNPENHFVIELMFK